MFFDRTRSCRLFSTSFHVQHTFHWLASRYCICSLTSSPLLSASQLTRGRWAFAYGLVTSLFFTCTFPIISWWLGYLWILYHNQGGFAYGVSLLLPCDVMVQVWINQMLLFSFLTFWMHISKSFSASIKHGVRCCSLLILARISSFRPLQEFL